MNTTPIEPRPTSFISLTGPSSYPAAGTANVSALPAPAASVGASASVPSSSAAAAGDGRAARFAGAGAGPAVGSGSGSGDEARRSSMDRPPLCPPRRPIANETSDAHQAAAAGAAAFLSPRMRCHA